MARTPEQNLELCLKLKSNMDDLLMELKFKQVMPPDYFYPSDRVKTNKEENKE